MTAKILQSGFQRYRASGDLIAIFRAWEEHKVEVSPEARRFLMNEFEGPLPQVLSRGNLLVLEFEGQKLFQIEVKEDVKDFVYVNGKAINISRAASLKDLKKIIVAELKDSDQPHGLLRLLDSVFPTAHADVGAFLTRYGGVIAGGIGLLLAANGRPALGLALGVGGLVYQVKSMQEEEKKKTKHE